MIRLVVACLALLSFGGVAPVVPDEPGLDGLFELLEASPGRCPEGLEEFGEAGEAVCFTVAGKFKRIKKTVNRYVKRPESRIGQFLFAWSRRNGYRTKLVLADHDLQMLLYDAEAGLLIAVPYRPCPRKPGIHTPKGEGYVHPTVISKVSPKFPEYARVNGIEGYVVLQVVVDREGKVGSTCVVLASSEVQGFKEAAVQAVLQWRYEPGTLKGKPVDTYVIIPVDWFLRY